MVSYVPNPYVKNMWSFINLIFPYLQFKYKLYNLLQSIL